MSIRTPLARVRGLGAAHTGAEHFWLQRVTAVALIVLVAWFVIASIPLVGADQEAVLVFFENPINAVLGILFVATALFHMTLGVQVVIEDYIHGEWMKVVLLMANRFFAVIVGAVSIFSILKIAI